MAERLKNIFFTPTFVDLLAEKIQDIHAEFDSAAFKALVYDGAWEAKELKQRMRHLTRCLHQTLPVEYPKALAILEHVAPNFDGFEGILFPDFVECYGLDYWDLSLPALREFTKYGSAEFAIRPFLAEDPARAMAYMAQWAKDENHHVRRLASEGCRPRLPWGMALSAFKKDPSPILLILEMLNNDDSEYVRKSVANNLNDISKDHPDLVLEIGERWLGQSKHTDWIVKHACRTLLKAGNPQAMRLFGFGDPSQLAIKNLTLTPSHVAIGEDLNFQFDLEVNTSEASQVRLEYGVYFKKAKGQLSRKVFQIKEADFAPGLHSITKKQSFVDRSTRKHYPGEHQLSVIVNGVEKAKVAFEVKG